MTEPLDLDAIQARCDAARCGPWRLYDDLADDGYPGHLWTVQNRDDEPGDNGIVVSIGTRADGEFIAAARQDVPALIREVGRLHDKLKTERAVGEHLLQKHTATLAAADEWTDERAALLARVQELETEQKRLQDVLRKTQQLAGLDSTTCESCGHLESAHHPDGDRECDASGARIRACSCTYFIACYPEPANATA